MRFFKNRPLLAALIVAALVGVASGGAYVVKHTLLTIDDTKPPAEIEADVESQLAQEGVTANVTADKTAEGTLQLTIASTDEKLPDKLRDMGAIVVGNGTDDADVQQEQLRIAIDDDARLDDAQMKRLTDVLTTNAVLVAVADNAPDVGVVLAEALAKAGFTDVEIIKTSSELIVRVKSAPTP